jgi:hypothetical protein
MLVAIALAVLTPVVADDSEPSFDPSGEIYDTDARVVDLFSASSPIRTAPFIADAPDGGDVLTRAALLELKENQDAVLADPASQTHLATVFNRDLGVTMNGVYSIANAVDEALPGGLDASSDAEVKAALSELLADGAPTSSLRFLLSTTSTTREPTTIDGVDVVVWKSPAFFVNVVYDVDTFDGEKVDGFDGEHRPARVPTGAARQARRVALRCPRARTRPDDDPGRGSGDAVVLRPA